MKQRNQKLLLLLGVIATPYCLNSMNRGQVTNERDNVFEPLCDKFKKNLASGEISGAGAGSSAELLSATCSVLQTPGISAAAGYFNDFYRPFVEIFGGSPDKASAVLSSIPTVQTAINSALPAKGGATTVTTEQAALTAINNFIQSGGPSLLFLNDSKALIAALSNISGSGTAPSTSAAANMDTNIIKIANTLQPLCTPQLLANGAVNLPTLAQCSNDLAMFLSTISSSSTPSSNLGVWAKSLVTALSATKVPGAETMGGAAAATDPSVVGIGMALLQPNDTYMSSDNMKVVDLPQLYAKIKSINNPEDTAMSQTSVFGTIDRAMARYEGKDFSDAPYNVYESPMTWVAGVAGALGDVNDAYSLLATYTTGSTIVSGFTYDREEYLSTIITNLVNAAIASSGGTGGDSSAGALTLDDTNLVDIAKALSGINGTPEGKDQYYTVDENNTYSIDPSKLSAMSSFATALRSQMDVWQGDQEDPSSAADPLLCYSQQAFVKYGAAMNSAVADETDILGQLPSIFEQIGASLNTPNLVYDTKQLPSFNIYGSTDEEGNPIQNPNGLYSVMYNALASSKPSTPSTPSVTLDNADSVKALATALADQIENHNQAVELINGRAGAMKNVFTTEDPTDSTTVTFINGISYEVSGAGGSATTRGIAQEVFYDVVNADNGGMISLLNNQATSLLAQAQMLVSAGAEVPFTATNGNTVASISNFEEGTVTVGTDIKGVCSVVKGELPIAG